MNKEVNDNLEDTTDTVTIETSSTADSNAEVENSKRPAKKIGRPKGAKNKRPVGRPKGTAGIMKEYRDRMLNSPKSRKVLDSIFDAALDNEHKNQAAAWKLLMDRMMPVAMFEQEVTKGGGRPTVSINITGIGGDLSIGSSDTSGEDEDIIEGNYSEED